jgi:tripartite-type tricarboxylate transporter receptor subunit TctC
MADPVADFYQGKQIRFIIRAAPGGNYDLYMRLLARYMVRYMPG